jgi:hypothetical protein
MINTENLKADLGSKPRKQKKLRGLSLKQFRVMECYIETWRADQNYPTLSECAHLLGFKSANHSREVIDVLIKKGYAQRFSRLAGTKIKFDFEKYEAAKQQVEQGLIK